MRELCLILIYIATVYAFLFVLMPTTVSILFFFTGLHACVRFGLYVRLHACVRFGLYVRFHACVKKHLPLSLFFMCIALDSSFSFMFKALPL